MDLGENGGINNDLLRLLLRSVCELKLLPPTYYLNDVKVPPNAESHQWGGFGDVYRGALGDEEIALKVLRVLAPTDNRDKLLAAFLREIVLWRQLRHPNIQPFLGVSVTALSGRLCVVSKWESRGSITKTIQAMSLQELLPLRNQWVCPVY